MRIRILTVSVLGFGIISSLPWSRAGARIFARESTSSHPPTIRTEMRSHLHFTPLVVKLSGFKRYLACTISFAMGANHRSCQEWKIRLLASFDRVFPQFFKSRSNVSRSFFDRRPATSSIAAACSPNAWVITAFIASFSKHERPTRPIAKAKALRWEICSTFYSRGPDRQSVLFP